MAGLTRKTLLEFGGSGTVTAFAQFGSKVASTPQTSKDPAVIQALAAWGQGWQNAIVSSDKAAYLQDMNGWCLVHSYMVAYIYQMGIPEWDSATLYFTGSVVQVASTGQWFQSLQGGVPGTGAGQSGNAPPTGASNAFWQWVNPPGYVLGTATLNKLPMVTNAASSTGVPGSATLGDSPVAYDATNKNIVLGSPSAPVSPSATTGIQFGDGTVQITASPNQITSQSPTPSPYPNGGGASPFTRVGSTEYQNLGTGKVRYVSIVVNLSSAQVFVYPTSGIRGSAVVQFSNSYATDSATLFFIVLPNYYYYYTQPGGGAPINWTEWY